MSNIISLSDPDAVTIAISGGKGAGLARLRAAGFAVPDAVIVTSDAYRRRVADTLARDDADALFAALGDIAGQAYAVRSSATLEDLAEASFAGQHDTVLNCTGRDEILAALRRCYASLWSERAVAYRHEQGISAEGAAMAVVVQRMVPARAAGVAFTLDPVLGRLDEIHISANHGLGESVVNGEAEVDRYVFAKRDLSLRQIAARPEASLTQAEAREIARTAAAIEQAFGFPQDIEWAIDGAGLHILQARPVTAIPPRWTRDESAERFPNIVTPLAWDFAEAGFHQALTASFARMGLPPLRGKWFARFDGYIYGDQNAVDLYLGRSPFAITSLEALRAALPEIARRFAWVEDLPAEFALSLDRFLLAIGELRAETLVDKSATAIWAHIVRINEVGRAYFRHNIAISIGHAAVHRALRQLLTAMLGEAEAAETYHALVAPMETRTHGINHTLNVLAGIAEQEPVLAALLARDTTAALARLPEFPAFAAAFASLLRDHGHRELDFDPYQPSWAEAPAVVLDIIAVRIGRQTAARPRHATRAASVAAELRIANTLPGDLAVLFSELVRLARLYTELDDHEHYQTTRLAPLLRRAVASLGARPAAEGLIADPLDLFFSQEAALAATVAADTPQAWAALAGAIKEEKAAYLAGARQTPPWSLAEAAPEAAAGDWQGIAGSPGIAEGPAFIVTAPEDFARFPAGAILVARATNPAWTALFARAAGIITESGGPLSHGAIAAREHGIPAVMAARDAMTRLSNGQRVRIDGSRGLVRTE